MEKKGLAERAAAIFRRLKYPILILLLGAALLLLPGKKQKTASAQPETENAETLEEDWEGRLETILAQIRGAGAVRIRMTRERHAGNERRPLFFPGAALPRRPWCPRWWGQNSGELW